MDLYKMAKAVDNMALAVGNSMFATAHFTCEETDSILTVMALAGYEQLAADALMGHVTDEDHGDRHRFIFDAVNEAVKENTSAVIAEQMCATYVWSLKR